MKKQLSVFIVNPANGELVTVAEWRNTENPTSAEFVAIVRDDKSGIILAKDPVKVDDEINFDWNKAVELVKAFKATTNLGEYVGPEGFRLMSRREALDIYDARFQGLDDALALIGGTPLNEGDARWMWTEDDDPDPEYNSYYAFIFYGNGGNVRSSGKYGTYTVRPVSAFTENEICPFCGAKGLKKKGMYFCEECQRTFSESEKNEETLRQEIALLLKGTSEDCPKKVEVMPVIDSAFLSEEDGTIYVHIQGYNGDNIPIWMETDFLTLNDLKTLRDWLKVNQ